MDFYPMPVLRGDYRELLFEKGPSRCCLWSMVEMWSEIGVMLAASGDAAKLVSIFYSQQTEVVFERYVFVMSFQLT